MVSVLLEQVACASLELTLQRKRKSVLCLPGVPDLECVLPLYPGQENRGMVVRPRMGECVGVGLRRGGLLIIQHPSTRLETRTKESNMCAS